MSYADTLLAIVIIIGIVGAMFVLSTIAINHLRDAAVVTVEPGRLPQCNETMGTPDGFYCQVNNASFFCKVDTTQPDPFVRTHAYCENPCVL